MGAVDPENIGTFTVAVVSVTVDRTGKVLSARIVRKTGDAALDRSVQSALDRVRSIGKPFPSGSNDSKRTFTLDFTPVFEDDMMRMVWCLLAFGLLGLSINQLHAGRFPVEAIFRSWAKPATS